MYRVVGLDLDMKVSTFKMLKIVEAVERALQNDYTIHYPDGKILECTFKTTTDA